MKRNDGVWSYSHASSRKPYTLSPLDRFPISTNISGIIKFKVDNIYNIQNVGVNDDYLKYVDSEEAKLFFKHLKRLEIQQLFMLVASQDKKTGDLCRFLMTTTSLIKFNITEKVENIDLRRILRAIEANPNKTVKEFQFTRATFPLSPITEFLKTGDSITTLVFENSNMTKERLKELSKVLAFNNSITKLDLHSNQIDPTGVEKLSYCLKTNSTITALDLGHNKIGNDLICHGGRKKAYGLKLLCGSLTNNITLTDLNLTDNQISSPEAYIISTFLERMSVTSLNLSSNRLYNAGAKYLLQSLKYMTPIKNLDLSFNKIADKEILSYLPEVKSDITIELSNNEIPEPAIVKFCLFVKRHINKQDIAWISL